MIDVLRVKPGDKPRLDKRDPGARLGLEKKAGEKPLGELHETLDKLQYRLYAEAKRAVLVVIQGIDGSGKDGVIRSVFRGLNPQGCRVASFKAPTPNELAHDYLWRVRAVTPARGEIGIFNRSHYEDVVTVRMLKLVPEEVWRRRPRQINEWERLLVEEGTSIVKVFLHVSKDEELARFKERVDNPEKAWKFRAADLQVHERYDEYMAAYDEAMAETSTEWAPWHVVPADHNWVKALAVAELLVAELKRLDPQLPPPDPETAKIKL